MASEKIQDPEFDPAQAVQVDVSLPKDPNVTNTADYERIAAEEKRIVVAVQQVELEIAGLRPKTGIDSVEAYRNCLDDLSMLISQNPAYASAKNNRAQAIRRMYGDGMLVVGVHTLDGPLISGCEREERLLASEQALSDLDACISSLSPVGTHPRLSPHAAKTLSMAHTQRAAIYHQTSKMMGQGGTLDLSSGRREASWGQLDFEEAASRDFALGGRFGNEIAKGLAVSTNPTAKLCGQMVREAMKKEYGPAQ